VLDPIITLAPVTRTNLPGDAAGFNVVAAGTEPIHFQWQFQGGDIEGATRGTLVVEPVDFTNAGLYSVVVSNSAGALASSPALLNVLAAPPVCLARWDFNQSDTAPPEGPSPCAGSGVAALVGAVQASFSSGSPSDGTAGSESVNTAWNTSGYPSQGNSNKTSGVEFHISTLGHRDVVITWEQRNSGSASRWMRVQYTVNGVDYLDVRPVCMSATNSAFVFFMCDLTGKEGVSDNPAFGFRLVTEFEATACGSGLDRYAPTSPSSSYTTSGSVRFDLVNVFARPVGLSAAPRLWIRREGTNAVLNWSATGFRLQSAEEPGASYVDVAGAGSPYTAPATGAHRVFRLKAQ
jgi:hypothetical protein